MLPLPNSESAWISDVLGALRRRSRALRRKVRAVECEKVFEEVDGVRSERIDLTLRQSRNGLVLRAKTWVDRWTWVDARAGGKNGWTMEWTFEGRAAGGLSGQGLIAAIEGTLDSIAIAKTADRAALDKLWEPLLLRGPKR